MFLQFLVTTVISNMHIPSLAGLPVEIHLWYSAGTKEQMNGWKTKYRN